VLMNIPARGARRIVTLCCSCSLIFVFCTNPQYSAESAPVRIASSFGFRGSTGANGLPKMPQVPIRGNFKSCRAININPRTEQAKALTNPNEFPKPVTVPPRQPLTTNVSRSPSESSRRGRIPQRSAEYPESARVRRHSAPHQTGAHGPRQNFPGQHRTTVAANSAPRRRYHRVEVQCLRPHAHAPALCGHRSAVFPWNSR
jgi:hypothetical protein